MRNLYWLIAGIAVAGISVGAYQTYQGFQPTAFEYEAVDLPKRLPPAYPPVSMRVSVLRTGHMHADQAFSFRGGEPGKEQISAMDALLVQHPKGDFLIDTGFGRDVDAHFKTTPFLMQLLASYEQEQAAIDQLESVNYSLEQLAGVILTHAHWDHVSGIPDLPEVPVWINQQELEFIRGNDPHAALIRSFTDVEYLIYSFDDGPYMGYPKSLDVYRDGSLVLVPIGGHTPGSTGIFITLPEGQRIMMLGDIVWAREGYEIPAERPAIPASMVDLDPAEVKKAIWQLHQIHTAFPDLLMVPAHDRRAFETLPVFSSDNVLPGTQSEPEPETEYESDDDD